MTLEPVRCDRDWESIGVESKGFTDPFECEVTGY